VTAHVVGIDEVGYGPSLGPMIVAAVAFEVPTPETDLWRTIGNAGGPVRDSKKLFTQARGIASIEPTALAYVGRLCTPASHAELWERLSPDPRTAPWYGDLAIPCAGPRPEPVALPEGVRIAGAWARILEASEFNRHVGTNKAELLFECAADLIHRALEALPGRVDFHVGRQGGRKFYLRHLIRHFGAVFVREERRDTSTYEISRGRIRFLTDGEDRHFLIALASIIGKYVRELSMRLFNQFWSARIQGLRATAGYGTDAQRFWRQIESHLASARLTADEVLRRR